MLVRNSAFHALLAYEESWHFFEKASLMFKQHGTSERKKSLKQKINNLHLLLKYFNSTATFIYLLITKEMKSAINTASGLMKVMAHQ